MKKILLAFILCILLISYSNASHIRAGDLVVNRISNLKYEFIFTLYRDVDGISATQSGIFNFGDGTTEEPGSNFIILGFANQTTEVLRYITTHTYAAPNQYTVSYRERNRNEGVNNFTASADTQFYIETTFLISSVLGLNQSPVLLIPPIDFANVGQRFVHNPGAFDFEGDSLSYRLTVCKQDQGKDVEGYSFPSNSLWSTNSEDGGESVFYIDPFTGDLIWDAPGVCGEYNVAFFVDEWRNGILIGSVNRDMQITVLESNNITPDLILPKDTCIVAGDKLIETISAFDQDLADKVKITIPQLDNTDGGIFGLLSPSNPATYTSITNNANLAEGIFAWQSTCNDIRSEPFQATFKVEDDRPFPTDHHQFTCLTDGSLADIKTWRITVVGPKPVIIDAIPNLPENDIDLSWQPYTDICNIPDSSKITVWRREGSFAFSPDNCTTGLPSFTGYKKIASINITDTSYTDTNTKPGLTYCYRLVVNFPLPKGGKSLASDEVCSYIPDNSVLLTKVSVTKTDQLTGQIELAWTAPLNEGKPDAPPLPYTYKLFRSETTNEDDFIAVFDAPISENNYIDTRLNTTEKVYYYRIDFFANGQEVDLNSEIASIVRLDLLSNFNSISLSWDAKTPWTNSTSEYKHKIYKTTKVDNDNKPIFGSTPITEIFPLVAGFNYIDKSHDLEENITYYYKILTRGAYDNPSDIEKPLENFSQETAITLVDIDAPCPPELTLNNDFCNNLETKGLLSRDERDPSNPDDECSKIYDNEIRWSIKIPPTESCLINDISYYKIYYAAHQGDDLTLYKDNIIRENTTNIVYIDEDLLSIAGCYAITAVDHSGNESDFSNIVCIDNCPDFYLPNAFSPSGSIGRNDTFIAYPCHRFVDKVDFKVFNRWGKLVFESDDNVNIEWDGKSKNGNQVSVGIYYYKAMVKFNRLRKEDEIKLYKGTLMILK